MNRSEPPRRRQRAAPLRSRPGDPAIGPNRPGGEAASGGKGDLTRRYIKDAIADLASRRDITTIGLADICAATRLTTGSIYFHFPNKDAAIEEMVIDEVEAHYRRLMGYAESGFPDFLAAIVSDFARYARKRRHLPRAIRLFVGTRRKAGDAWLAARQPILDRLAALISDLRAEHGLPQTPSPFLAQYILTSLEDLSIDAFQENNADTIAFANQLEQWRERNVALWMWAIRTPAS